jgi:hypothetical protein
VTSSPAPGAVAAPAPALRKSLRAQAASLGPAVTQTSAKTPSFAEALRAAGGGKRLSRSEHHTAGGDPGIGLAPLASPLPLHALTSEQAATAHDGPGPVVAQGTVEVESEPKTQRSAQSQPSGAGEFSADLLGQGKAQGGEVGAAISGGGVSVLAVTTHATPGLPRHLPTATPVANRAIPAAPNDSGSRTEQIPEASRGSAHSQTPREGHDRDGPTRLSADEGPALHDEKLRSPPSVIAAPSGASSETTAPAPAVSLTQQLTHSVPRALAEPRGPGPDWDSAVGIRGEMAKGETLRIPRPVARAGRARLGADPARAA